MSRDLVETLAALVVIAACAGLAISTALPKERREQSDARGGTRLAKAPRRAAVAATAPPAVAGAQVVARPVGNPTRPRIFTGEPGPPEHDQPAMRRALKLAGGLTAFALLGSIALLAIVRAMVAMLRKIAG